MASVGKREWTSPGGEKRSGYEVRYKDGTKHRSKTFRLKKEADAFRRKVESELADGGHIPESEARTVAQVCEMFVRHTEDRMSDGRIGKARHHDIKTGVDRHITPRLGTVKIKDLTWQIVERFYADCRKAGLGPRTIKKYADILRSVEDYAFKRGLTKQRVVTAANSELRGIPRGKVRTFTVQQIETLLAAVDARHHRGKHHGHLLTKCYVHLAAFCGLRFGEIGGLTWGCIDFEKRLLLIRHSLSAWDELKGPKTRAGVRDVPMPSNVAALLLEWRERFKVANERDLVLLLPSGRSVAASEFHAGYWKPLLTRAGLWEKGQDAHHFHALRHFAASCFVDMGMSLPRVAATLGHSTFDMTLQVYAHEIRGGDRQHDVVDVMSGRLLPPPSIAHDLRIVPKSLISND